MPHGGHCQRVPIAGGGAVPRLPSKHDPFLPHLPRRCSRGAVPRCPDRHWLPAGRVSGAGRHRCLRQQVHRNRQGDRSRPAMRRRGERPQLEHSRRHGADRAARSGRTDGTHRSDRICRTRRRRGSNRSDWPSRPSGPSRPSRSVRRSRADRPLGTFRTPGTRQHSQGILGVRNDHRGHGFYDGRPGPRDVVDAAGWQLFGDGDGWRLTAAGSCWWGHVHGLRGRDPGRRQCSVGDESVRVDFPGIAICDPGRRDGCARTTHRAALASLRLGHRDRVGAHLGGTSG